jgi:peptidoglycan hydrolase-like protein with peptidoglycan-binding domain
VFDRASVRSARSFAASAGVRWRGVVTPLLAQRLRIWSGPNLVSNCRTYKTVKAGSVGGPAFCVERRLARLGYAVNKVDRVFGGASARSLRTFQAENGLFVDGIAGPYTLKALGIWRTPPPPPVPGNSGSGRRIVYSKSQMRVWTVEANGRPSKTHLVSGNSGWNYPTPGTYSVFSKSSYTCAYGNSSVCWRYMVRFAHGPGGGNIGFHEIPVNLATGARLQSDAQLGQALSSGCVRQSTSDAIYMWHWAPIGTRVVVLP